MTERNRDDCLIFVRLTATRWLCDLFLLNTQKQLNSAINFIYTAECYYLWKYCATRLLLTCWQAIKKFHVTVKCY